MRFPARLNLLRMAYGILWAAVLGLALMRPMRFETDLLGMMGAPETPAQAALLNLAQSSAGRLQILVQGADASSVRADMTQVMAWAEQTGARVQTGLLSDQTLQAVLTTYARHRGGLLSEEDRDRLLAGKTAQVRQEALNVWLSPVAGPVSLADDPYGFLLRFWQALPFGETAFRFQDGFLAAERNGRIYGLVTVDMTPVPFAAWSKAIGQLENLTVQGVLHVSGAPVHAAGAALKSVTELNRLTVAGFLFVALLLLGIFHSVRLIVPAMGSIIAGFSGGWAVLMLMFDTPHLVTLVFGTTLIGLSIDYTFHWYLKRQKSILKPLLMAYLTTVISFAVLLLSSFSVLRQMAVFSMAGLSWVLGFVLLFGPLLFQQPPNALSDRADRRIRGMMTSARCFLRRGGWAVCLVLGVWGLTRVSFSDDVRALYRPDPALLARDAFFLDISGFAPEQAFWVVPGKTVQSVLETLETVALSGPRLSAFVPSVRRQQENAALIRQTYETAGLEKELGLAVSFSVPDTPPVTLETLPPALTAMMAPFISSMTEGVFALTPVSPDFKAPPDTYVVRPGPALTELLTAYRRQTYALLATAFAALMMVLGAVYRWRAGRLIAAPVLAILSVSAVLGWAGVPLSFFHFLSFFLIIGFSVDYSLFCTENENSGLAVALSCLTSAVSFGLLGLTSFPLTRAVGISLALGLVFSFFWALPLAKKELHCNYNTTGKKT